LGRFYFGLCLAFVIGDPLSGALRELEGFAGLHGWQWMFLTEGLLASLVGIIAYWYLRDRPADASWLTPEQRSVLEAELAQEAGAGQGRRLPLARPKIVNIASMGGLVGVAGLSSCVANKWAVIGLTKSVLLDIRAYIAVIYSNYDGHRDRPIALVRLRAQLQLTEAESAAGSR